MKGPAQGWLKLRHSEIKIYEESCILFLTEYGSKEKIKEQNWALKRTNIDWLNLSNYGNQIYLLIDQFRSIDETMTECYLVKSIINMVPHKIQVGLAILSNENGGFYKEKWKIAILNA